MKTLTSSAPFELYPGFAWLPKSNMADENMLFPMLLANLVACLELNLALFNLILVFHSRRTSVIRALDLPITVLEQGHHIEGREDFGFGQVEQAHGGTILFLKLLSQNREMLKRSQSRVFRACTYCLTYETAWHSAFSSVLVWTVENVAKTVVWTRIDRCVFDHTENGYF